LINPFSLAALTIVALEIPTANNITNIVYLELINEGAIIISLLHTRSNDKNTHTKEIIMTIMFHDEEEALESPRKRSRSPKNRDR